MKEQNSIFNNPSQYKVTKRVTFLTFKGMRPENLMQTTPRRGQRQEQQENKTFQQQHTIEYTYVLLLPHISHHVQKPREEFTFRSA
jgi:hypothetical protein